MDTQTYIKSGILELYALHLLSESEKVKVDQLLSINMELGEELERIYIVLENYATLHAVHPKEETQDTLAEKLINLEKERLMDPLDLPLLNSYSDYRNWKQFVKRFEENPKIVDGKAVKVLTHTDNITQLLVTLTADYEEEIHTHELESFLILSGRCLININGYASLLGQGDFMTIPLNEPHDVKLVSNQVVAILQRTGV